MNTLNSARTQLKFHCLYCGQHMECDPLLGGRQILCPSCLHRIVIPAAGAAKCAWQASETSFTWDTNVPLPKITIPTKLNGLALAT